MSKGRPLKIICFVLLASLPTAAQSSSELERKYGRPDNYWVRRIGYEVRPGIIMTVSFASDGQACEAVIEPKRVAESGDDWWGGMSATLVREIVDEVVPVARRGRQVFGMTMGNYTSWSWADYEKVKVSNLLVGVGRAEKGLKVEEVRIRWKERRCQ